MWLQKTAASVEVVMFPLTRFINGIGAFFLAMMMLVTTVDVTSRFFFNLPVLGSIEITGFLLVATILLAIPYAAKQKQHVAIDIVTARLSEKKQLILQCITTFVTLILFSVVVWRTIENAILMDKMHRVTAILQTPIAFFVLLVAFGFALTCLVLLGELLQNMSQAISNWKQVVLWL
ncbi:MAG: TRAP transporter small permease, partial [Desulfobacterales bacterium]|nr:TRAP transporter small permease [Desulfobacterales bacterium]